jgi:hypothetical protein
MSHKISFSFFFKDELERVYECFSNFYLYTEITQFSLITKAKKIKGDSFDEEGAIMEIIIKYNFPFRITVTNVKSSPLFKSYTHKLVSLDKSKMEIYIDFKFYWDSCEKKTVLFYDYYFNEEMYSIYKDLVKEKDKILFCNNVVEYLKTNFNGLEISKGILINASIQKVWNYINNRKNINDILLNKIKLICEINGSFEKLYSRINVLKTEKNSLLTSLILKNIYFSENKIELFFNNIEKHVYFPNLELNFCINKISEDASFLNIILTPNAHLSFETKNILSKYFLKCLACIKEHFKSKKKKDY